ncbi:hypothetical protein MDOR_10150 [Mycolicibacterium doricum]|nr:preprotein translocase subunit SecA [Mycolicibacterium doricum]MCV7266692.1 preprotein translocase subunit SecA [Mycolicibacterium doricum]BBZ06846.1 hypothetical protein MDOR_10150 [Mycolicibacterium doricum]
MTVIAESAALLQQAPGGEATLPWLEQQLADTIDSLSAGLSRYTTFAVCEVSRLNLLPWTFMQGVNFMDTDGGPARLELLTLLAAATSQRHNGDALPIWKQFAEWKTAADKIIQLSAMINLYRAIEDGALDPMAKIQASTRASEVLLRESSYGDMVKATLTDLFDPPQIKSALVDLLSFDLGGAISVLEACDEIQTDKLNERLAAMRAALDQGMANEENLTDADKEEIGNRVNITWDPSDDDVSASVAEIAERLRIPESTVAAVLAQFVLPSDLGSPEEVVSSFTTGDNALRTNPVISDGNGRFLLVHPSLVLPAIRENLEQRLKQSPFWNEYQAHRGKYLEYETSKCLSQVLPGADVRSGFEYFIPADETEAAGDPAGYTKLVEGDLLYLLDDVAVVAEEKAVALAPSARAGNTRRLRNDLVRIVTRAAEQAGRLKERMEKDRGFRLRDGTWVNTENVREIHTMAVSLEDLSGVSTATADMLRAGLLDAESIPWTVSLNDLRLIVELVDPSAVAVFLLYLRRRRHPEATVVFAAVDELDFFLNFFENGLYVQPDPELMRAELPYMTGTQTGYRRRRDGQARQFITSRTDPLDAWHAYTSGYSDVPARKPEIRNSPTIPLLRELQTRRDFGWCSIGATLLSGSTRTQQEWMNTPKDLIKRARFDGHGHSVTRPYGSNRADAWVQVWAVEDSSTPEFGAAIANLKDYIRAKKYQLRFPRAMALLFDSQSGQLHTALYDGTPLVADEYLDGLVAKLFPADKWQKSLPKLPNTRRGKRR